jgi:Tfp pilus assembly protein PilX
MDNPKSRQKGAVSLFIVIFVALLIVTIATAFIRIMIQDQLQATANDLSKSALDSANAGVEDAKRAIVEYYRPNPATSKPDCSTVAQGVNSRCDDLRTALFGDTTPPNDGWTSGCNATENAGVATLTNGEVLVKTNNADDDQLDQAYTCIKVQMNPPDNVGSLTPGTSKFIHLKSKDGAPFTKVKIQWYSIQQGQTLDLDGSVPYELPKKWPVNRPAVMRAQLLQYRSNFQLSDFDTAGLNKNNLTSFLLPSSTPGLNMAAFANDFRQNQTSGAPQQVSCTLAATSRYACEVTIDLPCAADPCDNYPTQNNDRDAYLKLSQYYSVANTDYRISMINSDGAEVRFADVQPVVDSTGRANDIFRRIRSRIDLGVSSVPNPEAAVDVTRSLCKEFAVTNDTTYFPSNSACPTPQN